MSAGGWADDGALAPQTSLFASENHNRGVLIILQVDMMGTIESSPCESIRGRSQDWTSRVREYSIKPINMTERQSHGGGAE